MIIVEYKRKPKIVQMQLDDDPKSPKIERYRSWVPREYNAARRKFEAWLPVDRRKKRKKKKARSPIQSKHRQTLLAEFLRPGITRGELEAWLPDDKPKKRRKGKAQPPKSRKYDQVPLDKFLYPEKPTTLPKPSYLLRFPSIPQPIYEDFAKGVISSMEWNELQDSPDFTGYFDHLFEFNDLSFFDDLQSELEEQGVSFKNFSVRDVIVFELFRRQVGFHDYTGTEKLSYFNGGNPLIGILRDSTFFPSAADISYVLTRLPAQRLVAYFHELVRECLELGVIKNRVLILDGQFIHSNCNDNKNKEKGAYNDPDAGYCRHNGVKKGVGYDYAVVYAYCGWDRVLPVHFKTYPGNRNDNPAFRETLAEFISLKIGKWIVVLIDTGGYSEKTNKLSERLGLWPVIRAKKNLKTQPTREMKKGYYFNTNYLPPGWTDEDLLKLYEARPAIESGNSSIPTFYNAKRLNTRGTDMATVHRALHYILDLLRALTAYKIGRPDLTLKLTAFSMTRESRYYREWQMKAEESGYIPLNLCNPEP